MAFISLVFIHTFILSVNVWIYNTSNFKALKLYFHVAALYKRANCAFQQVRNEQALHEKASAKWQVVSSVSPGPLSHAGTKELLPPVPRYYQVLQCGWPQFGFCGSRLALMTKAQDSCEGGMWRLDSRPRKPWGLSKAWSNAPGGRSAPQVAELPLITHCLGWSASCFLYLILFYSSLLPSVCTDPAIKSPHSEGKGTPNYAAIINQ